MLQGLNIQQKENGTIIFTIHISRLINELQYLETDAKGMVYGQCKKRFEPPANGKKYTHLHPTLTKIDAENGR